MADCCKGEEGVNLPKSHLTTLEGEFLYFKDSLDVVLDGGVLNYDHKDIPGLVPLIVMGGKLELIQRPGFSQPLRGIYREVIRQLSEELRIEYKTVGAKKVTVLDEPPYFNPEAIRAARVFLQDVSTYFYKFGYHPSKLINQNQKDTYVN